MVLPPRGERLWQLPGWRLAFSASAISTLGDLVFDITVVLWISTQIAAGKSWAPAAVSGVLLAAALPMVLVGPLAGVYSDRHDRRSMMLAANLVQSLSVGSLLLVPLCSNAIGVVGQLVWIYLAIAVANSAAQFFMQGRLAMITRTVPDRMRTTAFSVQGSANSLLAIVGPPLAAPLLFSVGVGWALAIDAVSFAVSCLLLRRIEWDSAPERANLDATFGESLREGARAVAANKVLLAICIAVTVVTLAAGGTNVLEVFFVQDVLHRRAALLGVLAMAFGIGTLVGVAIAPRVERRIDAATIFVLGVMAFGLLVVAFSRMTELPAALVLWALVGIPLGLVNTVLSPLAIRSVPSAVLGRAIVVLNVLPTVAGLLSTAATGWVVSTALRGLNAHLAGMHFGPIDTVFTASGLLTFATGLAVWRPIRRGREAADALAAASAEGAKA